MHFEYDMISNRENYIKEKSKLVLEDDVFDQFNDLQTDDDITTMLADEYVESKAYQAKLKNIDVNECKACGSSDVYPQEDIGYMVCGTCGEDNGSISSNNKDWNKDKTTYLQSSDRCNNISTNNIPSAGPKLILKGHNSESLLFKIHKWSSVTYMWKIYKYMESKCKDLIENERLTLQIVKDGFYIYQDVYNYQLFRGNIRKGVIASCILYVIRSNNDDLTEDELAHAFGITEAIVLDGYKRLINILHKENIRSTYIKPSEANDYVSKFSIILNITDYGQTLINNIITKMHENNLARENNPKTQVTSCIFLIASIYGNEIMKDDSVLTKKIIAQKCKISEVTLYKCYTKLLENLDSLIDLKKLTQEQVENLSKLKSKRYKRRK
jgi:transcription initiation factor TFIIIB Brf1 subunit/transcription initiation factor TFIIB